MSQKEDIIKLLNINGRMTQGILAESMYGDKKHGPNIYMSLMDLVKKGIVIRSGSSPAYYSLSGMEIAIHERESEPAKKGVRDVSGDVITNVSIEEVEALVQGTDSYGPENDLITRCLQKFPL